MEDEELNNKLRMLKEDNRMLAQWVNTIEDKLIYKIANIEAEIAMLKLRLNRHTQIGNPCHVADKQDREE